MSEGKKWKIKPTQAKRGIKKQRENYRKGFRDGNKDAKEGKYSVFKSTFKSDSAYRLGYDDGWNKGAPFFEKKQKAWEQKMRKVLER